MSMGRSDGEGEGQGEVGLRNDDRGVSRRNGL